MTAIATHTSLMTGRQLRALARQPAYLVISLIQPVIWLFLFGSLFRKIVELPGFGTASYLDYLVPGVVIMSALSTSMWSGMTVLEEIDRGIMDRFLVLPLHRSAIINASVIMQSLMTTVQSLIIVALGWAAGAHYPGRRGRSPRADRGVGADRGGVQRVLEHGRHAGPAAGDDHRHQHVPAAAADVPVQSAFIVTALMPHWMRNVADGNPVNWALEAGRAAMSASPDWSRVLAWGGGLALLASRVTALSVLTFRAYQKSV